MPRPKIGGKSKHKGGFKDKRRLEPRKTPNETEGHSGYIDAIEKKTIAYLESHIRKPKSKDSNDASEGSSDRKFQLDPWQENALELLRAGHSVIVDAPTTAGKTRIVEAFFRDNIADGTFRAAYTTPVKSLSNDKLLEFRNMFGKSNVGIATGDIKDNLQAPIVVATLESYRNSLLGVEPDLGRSLVVFDEYHFLQDESRGSAWEEAIILSPQNTQMLLLSASVANPEQFCAWISAIKHKSCFLVTVKERPVPLEHLIFHKDRWLLANDLELPKLDRNHPRIRFPIEHDDLAYCLVKTEPLHLTPCIIYAGQRLQCESIINSLQRTLTPLIRNDSQIIKELLDSIDRDVGSYSFLPTKLRQSMIMYGIAYHHSGLAPLGRLAVERLLKEGHLRFCAATMGLSIGINFAVRSALISDYRRPGSSGMTQYDPSEILQMLGRAGRRGQDTVGFSLWANAAAYQKFIPANREAAYSRLRNDPTTFLGLIGRGYNLAKLERFYQDSFLKFLNRKTVIRVLRHDVFEKHLGSQIPCKSPANAYAMYTLKKDSLCKTCPFVAKCHQNIKEFYSENLALLHIHLHKIGALDVNEGLTEFGSLARYFPQTGGMVVAKKLVNHEISVSNLLAAIELMAALTLARFKEPTVPNKYKFPFDIPKIEEDLEMYYPYELFEELYDQPFGKRDYPILKEFNPNAGYAIKEWMIGDEFQTIRNKVCHEKFAPGDLVNLIYRTGTFLQSLAQTGIKEFSYPAKSQWRHLLRPPLTPTISLGDPEEIPLVEEESN